MRNTVDGLALPQGIPGPLKAWVTPPVVEKATTPRAHVWGGRLTGRRQSAPRGQGFMELSWVVDVYACYLTTPDDGLHNEPFPKVVDAILKAYLAVPISVWIDADGNQVGPNAGSKTDTQIQAVAETFDSDYPPERSVAGPRMLWYVQRLGVGVKEVIQA